MQTIDFQCSFLTFRIDTLRKPPQTVSHKPPFSLNNARIQIECRLTVAETTGDWSERYVLGANCKTERVGVERDIWTEPNADYVPIFSNSGFLNLKTYARAGQDVELYPPGSGRQTDRQTGRHDEAFDSIRIDLSERPGKLLESTDEIVATTLANTPLIARTTIDAGRYTAVVEYPIKTMNANERDGVYQTDTGPILLPDFSAEPGEMLDRLQLAFAAFNGPDWIELLVRVPTAVTEDVSVYHYSKPTRFDARNEIIALS